MFFILCIIVLAVASLCILMKVSPRTDLRGAASTRDDHDAQSCAFQHGCLAPVGSDWLVLGSPPERWTDERRKPTPYRNLIYHSKIWVIFCIERSPPFPFGPSFWVTPAVSVRGCTWKIRKRFEAVPGETPRILVKAWIETVPTMIAA